MDSFIYPLIEETHTDLYIVPLNLLLFCSVSAFSMPVWISVLAVSVAKQECPKQPTNVECGFYVMKYMKDLIRDERILSRGNFNGKKKTYTKAEIDEVRADLLFFYGYSATASVVALVLLKLKRLLLLLT
ncbi:hypothetical protein RHSIM_Rhsim05G0020800 [Rhododendron simsii]|uniref:Ubiquitin-like protease family profile domain-containing protein n=1 Tax=Rhododendron simsii TaxID=118357 RepID=A0A834LNK5_RHOSS|nr:hypothetical protein RHSIM_Rhsim05G0020800 [Rhododendron simsii]